MGWRIQCCPQLSTRLLQPRRWARACPAVRPPAPPPLRWHSARYWLRPAAPGPRPPLAPPRRCSAGQPLPRAARVRTRQPGRCSMGGRSLGPRHQAWPPTGPEAAARGCRAGALRWARGCLRPAQRAQRAEGAACGGARARARARRPPRRCRRTMHGPGGAGHRCPRSSCRPGAQGGRSAPGRLRARVHRARGGACAGGAAGAGTSAGVHSLAN